MVNNKRKKTQEKISRRSPMEKLTIFLLLLFLTAVLVSAYTVIRKTASRISSDFYFPFLKSIRATERSMANSLLVMEDKSTLAKAVLQLRQEKFTLLARQSIYNDLAKENAKLRKLLKMPPKKNFRVVIAQLLYRDETGSTTVFLLDKGEKDGVKAGSIIVTPVQLKKSGKTIAVVVGRVTEVSRHTSTAVSIYDKSFKLSVTFSNTTGVMQYLPSAEYPMCGITFIPLHAKIRKNAPVYTSSLTGNAPAGIPVGRISSITKNNKGLNKDHVYQQTFLIPFADPSSIHLAAIYVPEKNISSNTGKRNFRK